MNQPSSDQSLSGSASNVAGGKDVVRHKQADAVSAIGERELAAGWRKARTSLEEAVTNRGREAHALKSLHDHLQQLLSSGLSETEKANSFEEALAHLSRLKDWDRMQWFKTHPPTTRDASGKLISEHELVQSRNRLSKEQMAKWDEWALEVGKPFARLEGSADEQIAALDDYVVRRVALDSVKNFLRRRPAEGLVNEMFAAMAQNKVYIDSEFDVRIRALKDEAGQVRNVEERDGKLFFEGGDELVPIKEDEHGRFVELPDDSDMIVFEKRTIGGARQIVPVCQPNGRDPNIQWFNGASVKRGWDKEQRFFRGPQAMSMHELYGFFPDHFPMRITNSVENRVPTEKVGGAIYGYAKEHAGRQSRVLICEYGTVMPTLKRNNSQLINDARQLFGLQKAAQVPNRNQASVAG